MPDCPLAAAVRHGAVTLTGPHAGEDVYLRIVLAMLRVGTTARAPRPHRFPEGAYVGLDACA